MTKREEIREGIAKLCCTVCEPADRGCGEMDGRCEGATDIANQIFTYLHSQGVMIKPKELPLNPNRDIDFQRAVDWDCSKFAVLNTLESLVEGGN